MLPALSPHQSKSNLRAFSINGLFGTRDVTIKLDKPVMILLGENGLGKTTTLNALYYTITGDFAKLSAIPFEKIILDFWHSQSVEILRDDLAVVEHEMADYRTNRYDREIWHMVENALSRDEKNALYRLFENSSEKDLVREVRSLASRISVNQRFPSSVITRAILNTFGGKAGKIESIKEAIKSQIAEEIIYFPTYRRIEEELHNLGSNKVEFDKKNKLLIQFGMKDVKDTLDEVLLKIKNSAIVGFSKITGDMLEQYVDGLNELDFNTRNKIQPAVLKIILERVGENISQSYKDEIIKLVSSRQIFEQEEKYKHLINFLAKLIVVYEEQSGFDNSIKKFAAVCNKYLYGKKVFYNESKVTLSIIQIKDGTDIELKSLSSGEKQILSLFAKIYFETGPELIVLFDEPELSLSIEWQRMLLPDVIESGKCKLLLTVTHSPFVFDNELDEMAEDMSKYVVER
jgi:predicted ATP-dependent endonuclease of OLD family